MSLLPARRGYAYQHLYSAAIIADSLRCGFEGAYVDRKRLNGDIFDDLEVKSNGAVTRLQFKSHTIASRPFALDDLRDRGAFPLVEAFKTYANDSEPADDYRLIATWGIPDPGEAVEVVLPSEDGSSLLPGSRTAIYQLGAQDIWPEAGPAEPFASLGTVGTRRQFLDFCGRFQIELEAPPASLEVDNPGELEVLLFNLLRNQLGVGLWPNEARHPEDVAASAVWAVTRAGARPDLQVDRLGFVQALSLVVDYGRVPEAFPIDERWLVSREQQVGRLLDAADEAARLVVTGPPGSGKSWLLRNLASRAEHLGWATSIHFCYVDPLDVSLRRRTTVEATLGSLIAGLEESCDYVHPTEAPLYSSRPEDLVAHVEAAAKASGKGRVLLVVDGLDHASRTELTGVGGVSQSQVIAEALADLRLPSSACLVVGSQPGSFLDSLTDATSWQVAPWAHEDVLALLTSAGWAHSENLDEVASLLHQASGGNPLYLTYLLREVESASGREDDPALVQRTLKSLPAYDADLSGYYSHLLKGIESATGSIQIAEMLALLDFPLSSAELKAMLPASKHHVDAALQVLRPVLTEAATQGGLRVYHESFQRFIRAHLFEQGADFADLLKPAVEWLNSRGFFEDSRAFRSLPRTLALANRSEEAFALCGHDFVARAVSQGFGFNAITQSLRDIASAAGMNRRWDVLARINELMNAANTCFDGKLADDEAIEFARALAKVRNPASITERLVWEGRPEWGYRTGLLLCGSCDQAGAVAPWDAYFDAYSLRDDQNTSYGEASDELLEESILRGRIRLSDPEEILDRIVRVLGETEDVSPRATTIGKIVAETLGPQALDSVINLVEGRNRSRLLLGKAEHLRGRDPEQSRSAAQLALEEGLDGTDLGLALALGAKNNASSDAETLVEATKAVLAERSQFDPKIAADWLACLSGASDDDLEVVSSLLVGAGWYRCWLRYCVELERLPRGRGMAVAALDLLRQDVRPFVGKPRACDLYSLRDLIHSTIGQGLGLVTEEEWQEALAILAEVSEETTTYLQRSPGGPLTAVPLLHIVMSQADTKQKLSLSAAFVRDLIAEGAPETTYYETHAHFELVRAQAEALLGDSVAALSALDLAARYLTAYGFRKDITIFGLLHGLQRIHDTAQPDWTRQRLASLQAPVEALLTHTDGKETRHAFPLWNEMIAELDPVGALRYFALRLRRSFATMDYTVERALTVAIRAAEQSAPLPRIALALCLLSDGAHLFEGLDCEGQPLCQSAQALADVAVSSDYEGSEVKASTTIDREAVAPVNPECSLGELCESLRHLRWGEASEQVVDDFASAGVSHVISSPEPRMALARIAIATESLGRNLVLEKMATRLLEANQEELAAECLVYAFTRSGDGWRNFGEETRVALIEEAVSFSEDVALRALVSEAIEFLFARPGWNGITEQLPLLVSRFGGLAAARQVWFEAFAVVEYRLPATGEADRMDVLYQPAELESQGDLNSALAETVFSRTQHVSHERRARAVLAAALLLAAGEADSYEALPRVMSADMSVSAESILLALLADFGMFDLPTDDLLELVALAEASDQLCLRVPARSVLRRAGIAALSPSLPVPEVGPRPNIEFPGRDSWKEAASTWEEFPELLLSMVQQLHKEPWVQRRMTGFIDNVTSPRDRREWGRTWNPLNEAEEIKTSRLAASVRSALAAQGELDPTSEERVAAALLPDWVLRVRYEASRIVRPSDLTLPGDADAGLGMFEAQPLPDGPYREWVRVGHLEHERRKGNSYFDPASEASTYCGLCFGDYEVDGLPFGIGRPQVWLRKSAGLWPWGFVGPLVGIALIKDYAGPIEVPVLHPKIVSSLRLRPGEWHSGLTLIDSDGQAAAVMEQWRGPIPSGQDLAEEFPDREGAQLLMRPDVVEQVRELARDVGRWWQWSSGLKEIKSSDS